MASEGEGDGAGEAAGAATQAAPTDVGAGVGVDAEGDLEMEIVPTASASWLVAGRACFGHKGRIFWCSLRGGGDLVATACEDGSVGVWSADGRQKVGQNGKPKKLQFAAHKSECLRVAWDSASRSTLYSGGAEGVVKQWRVDADDLVPKTVQENEEEEEEEEEEEARAGAAPKRARRARAELMHAASCSAAKEDGQVYALAQFDQRPELAVAHDGSVTVLHKERMEELLTWRYRAEGVATVGGPRNPDNSVFVFDACASASGTTLVVSALSDGTVRARDLRSPLYDAWAIPAHDSYATCCAVSASGMRVASASGDGTVAVWDSRTLKCLRSDVAAHAAPAYGVAFLPAFAGTDGTDEGLVMSWSASGLLGVHDVGVDGHSGLALLKPSAKHRASASPYPVYCTAVDPAAGRIIVCGGVSPDAAATGAAKRGFGAAPSLAQGAVGNPRKAAAAAKERALVPWLALDVHKGFFQASKQSPP